MPKPTPRPVVLDRAASKAADDRARRRLGLPTGLLMENAGRGLAIVTVDTAATYECTRGIVLAGRGSNGGDGVVAARHLRTRGFAVEVWKAFPGPFPDAAADSGPSWGALRGLGVRVREAGSDGALRRAAASAGPRTVWIDALLGTGLEGPVEGHLATVLAWLAGRRRVVVAADLPSGLDADSGALLGPVARCTATATFLACKPGLLRGEGPGLAGRVVTCDIGVPVAAVTTPKERRRGARLAAGPRRPGVA